MDAGNFLACGCSVWQGQPFDSEVSQREGSVGRTSRPGTREVGKSAPCPSGFLEAPLARGSVAKIFALSRSGLLYLHVICPNPPSWAVVLEMDVSHSKESLLLPISAFEQCQFKSLSASPISRQAACISIFYLHMYVHRTYVYIYI